MIERKDQRRARGTVFYRGKDENGHDMYTATNYTGDVFYDNWDARGDGETGWRKVDISLAVVDAGWQVQFAPYVATMPQLSTGNLLFADKRAESGKRKNMQWELEALAVAPVQGVASGREVIYTDAYGPGAHLVYRAQRHGVAKLVRIDPDSAVTGPFVFRAHLPAKWKVVRQGEGGEYELLPTGKKELNTGKRTAFVGDGEETYAAPFMWRAGKDPLQKGVLTVTAEHIGGNVWEITKTIPQDWSRADAVEMDVTATSTLNSDGQLQHAGAVSYATCVAGSGTAIDSTATVMQCYNKDGGSGTRYCVRPYMVFTNSVPALATISAVRVKLMPKAFVALNGRANNVQALAPFAPADPASVVIGDYLYGVGMPNVALQTRNVDGTDVTNAVYLPWEITNAAHIASYVTKGGYDKWAIRDYSIAGGPSNTDLYYAINGGTIYNSTVAGYVDYEATENAGSNPPVEEIDYTVPAGGQNLTLLGVS